MKITCDREPLAAAFQLAASVAPSRSPKEILQNVKMTVTGGTLVLTATDMEVGIRVELEEGVEVHQEGTALLPVSRSNAILRESSDDRLIIDTDDSGVKITGSRSKFRLPSANPDEFPRVIGFEETSFHRIPTGLFREMLRRTAFATDSESSRYALGGVLLEMEDSDITAVGTDGRRLACMKGTGEAIGGHHTTGTNTIVPTRAIQLIERALSDKDETVDVAARSNDILVKTPRCTIYSRLVEGRYPNWRQVLPQRTTGHRIDMVVGPMFSALRQAAIVADQETRGIDLTFVDGTLRLIGSTAEIGDSQVELPIAYTGDEVTLTLDHRFIADFCKVLDAETSFTFDMESGQAPALLTTEDGYGYVIMPMARDR
jgi:DNA polymerase III subunit beta